MAEGDGQEVGWLEDLADQIREWHTLTLEAGGGARGEHADRLLASCGRAFQTAFGAELYPTDIEKAAALFHSIICNHAFVDGNKRTATFTVVLFLVGRDALLGASPMQVNMIGVLALETARSGLTVEEVARWPHRILDP